MPIKGGERPLKTAQEQGWTGAETVEDGSIKSSGGVVKR